jgi:TPR repeat protein
VESGNGANPPASSAEKNTATDTGAGGTTSATNDKTGVTGTTSGTNTGDTKIGGPKTGATPTRNSQNSVRASVPPAGVKPPENSPAQVAADPARSAADASGGQEEFAIARDILRGSSRQQDFSKAVALLWSSVRKGHVPAEVTLADLYRRGDGVEKNCDQARVLLVAASKKGSVEARQMLEQIAERGCE